MAEHGGDYVVEEDRSGLGLVYRVLRVVDGEKVLVWGHAFAMDGPLELAAIEQLVQALTQP